MSKHYNFTLASTLSAYSRELQGVYFHNDWLMVCNGFITIKRGYSWDGCTFAIDTIETYVAGCIHDAFYQFHFMSRKQADKAFYDLLKQNGFQFAKFYYISVRLFGGLFY